MSSNDASFLDEFEEERIVREYEEERAIEDGVLNISKLNNFDHSQLQKQAIFDKCLNISDNEYLENLSLLDNESDRSSPTNNRTKPLFIDTSVPPFALDNLNCRVALSNNSSTTTCSSNLNLVSDHNDLNSSNSTLNSGLFNSNGDQTTTSVVRSPTSSNDQNLFISSVECLTRRKKKSHFIITFELISARTVTPNESTHNSSLSYVHNSTSRPFVLYTIIIKRIPGLETQPGILEKRYSDFLRFFLALRKNFPEYFQEFPFPKKIYSNNFEADVIAERSVVFQHLLTFCLSIPDLRHSKDFYEFVLGSEFKKCRRSMRCRNFEEAAICLENLLFILIKLNRIESTSFLRQNMFITRAALAACLNESENFNESVVHAEQAFNLISTSSDFNNNQITLPLLLLCVQLNSRLDRCCKAHNQKLIELTDDGITYDRRESIMDLFVLKNFFILPYS